MRRLADRRDLALAGLTVLCAPLAYAVTFTGFATYDDEGYLTLAMKQLLAGGHGLYHDILAQYGPSYFEFWSALFGFGAIPVSTNITRGFIVVLWLVIALICGLATRRFTNRLAPAAAVLLAVVILNFSLAVEPIHPGSLIELLLALIALTLSTGVRTTRKWAVVGVLVGILLTVKVNVGGLAGVGLLFAAACACASTGRTRWLQLAAGGLMIVVPFLLTAPDLDNAGIQVLAGLVATSAAAVVFVVLPRRGAGGVSARTTVAPLLLGALGAAIVSVVIAWVAFGTGPGAVIDQTVIKATDQRDLLSALIRLPFVVLDFGLAALVIAVALRRTGLLERLALSDHPGLAAARLLAGFAIILSIINGSPLTFGTPVIVFGLATPLAWMAVLPRPGLDASQMTARAGLVALAVLQPLHAYPVAGSQLRWGALLLLLCGGICLADGVELLHRRAARRPDHELARFAAVAATGIVVAFGVKIAVEQVGADTQSSLQARSHMPALRTSGANRVHLDPAQTLAYDTLIPAIHSQCDTLVTFPAMASLNLWSHVAPPSAFNQWFWPWLLNDRQERGVVTTLRRSRRPCLVRNDALLAADTGGRRIPDGPLVRYLQTGWKTDLTVGDFQLQKPE